MINSKFQELPYMDQCSQVSEMYTYINPIALRMTKTPLSFGRSKCNKVKQYIIFGYQQVLLTYLASSM